MREKIRCFAYGKRSDVQWQQQVLNSRRTAEESGTKQAPVDSNLPYVNALFCKKFKQDRLNTEEGNAAGNFINYIR